VFREKENRWFGPYSVHNASSRLITVVNDSGQLVTHAIPQVKPYLPGFVNALISPLTDNITTLFLQVMLTLLQIHVNSTLNAVKQPGLQIWIPLLPTLSARQWRL
jgi:hypothetical protein